MGPPPDAEPPVVIITTIIYNAVAGQITLEGTATDNVGVVSVEWENAETAGAGNCNFAAPDWDCDIPVQAGDNTITITAEDAIPNQGTDVLVVNHTACAAGGTTVIKKNVVVFDDW